jgi:hypothetical protein
MAAQNAHAEHRGDTATPDRRILRAQLLSELDQSRSYRPTRRYSYSYRPGHWPCTLLPPRAQRWNLDFVTDAHGDVIIYYYNSETNYCGSAALPPVAFGPNPMPNRVASQQDGPERRL